MSRIFIYLGRFALILAGYAVASLAASAFLHVVSLGSLGFTADEAPAVVMGSIVFSIPFVALFVAYFAFLPAIPAILLSEILGKRDWLYHAISGARRGARRRGLHPGRGGGAATKPSPTRALRLALIGGGMCGGIAYWLVAGRLAGNWRGRVRRPVAVDATQVE